MAFRDWLNPQAAIVAISAIDDKDTPHKKPTIATIATIADVESSKQATNDHYENIVVSENNRAPTHYLKSVVTTSPPNYQQRYAHLITCQQCEHLTLTGYCRVKPQYKPLPEAMRDCVSFETLQGERVVIENAPYSKVELNDLLKPYEKKLFDHLLKCKQCDFEAARYCAEVFTTGSSYDALLLVFDDAASKREALLNTVIRACISGRSVYVPFGVSNLKATTGGKQ